MSLSQVLDQDVPVRFLRNIVSSGRIPNGLLFWGPDGVGKYFTALQFAKSLNCREAAPDACGKCLMCRKIDHGNHPDLRIIRPRGKSVGITKKQLEEDEQILELVAFRPIESGFRIVIFENAETINTHAQNYFLKTLEEPPSQTVFVFITAAPRKLLPTTRSRCQHVRFGALQPATVKQLLLQHRQEPEEVAEAIAAVSQGQMSRAFDLVDSRRRDLVTDVLCRLGDRDDPLLLSEEFCKRLKAEAEAIKNKIQAEAKEHLDPQEMSKEEIEEQKQEQEALIRALVRRATMEYLYLMSTWYRDVLVFHSTRGSGRILNTDLTGRLESASAANMDAKFKAIEKAWLYTERNLNTDRVFRDLFCTLTD